MILSTADRHSIDHGPRPAQELLAHLDEYISGMRREEPYVLGFPGNLDFGFGRLSGLLDIFANNVGDPGSADKSDVGAKMMERAVIDFMAGLANAKPEQIYGYVAAGGSEANQFGLDRGCTRLPEAKIFCSRDAHYSIRKNARLMRKELVVVDCDSTGRMDADALAAACRGEAGRGAVVVATIGTTMAGAIDDIDAIIRAAAPAGQVYVHLDAALGGLLAPFTEHRRTWGFLRDEVGSISVSMHKMLGMPVPCAVAMCRSGLVDSRVEGEYVGATDATLGCSRSGLASALLWYSLASKGVAGLEHNARTALETASYTATKLEDAGQHPVLHPESIVVVFDRPVDWICRKYHLATEGDRAHIVTVPHVRKAVVDELVRDIVDSRNASRAVTGLDATVADQLSQWLTDYIGRPHDDLGRPGAICPFVEPALRAGGVVVRTAAWEPAYGADELARIIEDAVATFESTEWVVSEPNRQAVVVALPTMPEHQWPLVDEIHRRVKRQIVEAGLMLGQFHPECCAPAVRNKTFPVDRAPVPVFVVRRMAVHDILFLADDPHWFRSYRSRFGDLYDSGRVRDSKLLADYARARNLHRNESPELE